MFQYPLSLVAHFDALDTLLCHHIEFWQGMPFECVDLPWRNTHPELCRWLDSQSLEELQSLKESPAHLASLVSTWLPEVTTLQALCHVPTSTESTQMCAEIWSTGIPGRKWAQIAAFNNAIPSLEGNSWLEWCAGKGYLGRVLAVSRQTTVTSLEWQDALCHSGQTYADKHALSMRFIQGDAFSKESRLLVDECDHAVALHACGDLHVTLLRHCVNASNPITVTVSPCCYHLINDECYQPLSSSAKQSVLSLNRHDLKLPLQETVTAGKTDKNKRYIEVTFRLGFDSLQREINNNDVYLPVPNVQKSLLNKGFEAFCSWAAMKKGIIISSDTDYDSYLAQGESRFLLVEKMETIRTLFRRSLEMWLVFDRALYLTENGFETKITTFCERALTPRNLLIHAKRKIC